MVVRLGFRGSGGSDAIAPYRQKLFLILYIKKTMRMEAIEMAHLAGFKAGAVGHMIAHYTRNDGDPEQEKYAYRNQRIDKSRTHLNYCIFEREDSRGFVNAKVAEADTDARSTTNVLCDWIFTLPKCDLLAGRERECFEEAFCFLRDKVGEQNIVGAWVHNDESSPHMHFAFVPVCEQVVTTNDKSAPLRWTERDEKKDPSHKAGEVKRDSKGTVRYKRVPVIDEDGNPVVKCTIAQSRMFDRKAMQSFHPELSDHMKAHFGFDVGVMLDEDDGDKVLSQLGHAEYIAAKTTIAETRKELERLEDEREEIREKVDEEADRLESLRGSREAAQERVAVLEAVASECAAADAAPLERKVAILDRIADLCDRCAKRIGRVVRNAGDAVQKRLVISVRHTSDTPDRLGGKRAAAERIRLLSRCGEGRWRADHLRVR